MFWALLVPQHAPLVASQYLWGSCWNPKSRRAWRPRYRQCQQVCKESLAALNFNTGRSCYSIARQCGTTGHSLHLGWCRRKILCNPSFRILRSLKPFYMETSQAFGDLVTLWRPLALLVPSEMCSVPWQVLRQISDLQCHPILTGETPTWKQWQIWLYLLQSEAPQSIFDGSAWY